MVSETARKYEPLTSAVINAFFHVYNVLGTGFLEKVYRNALRNELRKRGFKIDDNVRIDVFYDGDVVGEYYADLLVNDVLILETKAIANIVTEHECQLVNYLKATGLEVGLILNFGAKPQHRRKILDNPAKQSPASQAADPVSETKSVSDP
jgi:GxxExxY protein